MIISNVFSLFNKSINFVIIDYRRTPLKHIKLLNYIINILNILFTILAANNLINNFYYEILYFLFTFIICFNVFNDNLHHKLNALI